MKTAESAGERAKLALRKQFHGATDAKGYVDRPPANLVPGVRLDQFDADLRQGDGNELRMKFCAVHSSAALAVNCFAPFTDEARRGDIEILGCRGALEIKFEKRLPIFSKGRPCNLDVWIDFGTNAIAIESKMIEYLRPTRAEFASAYESLAPPGSEQCWWDAYNEAKGQKRHLDCAQLVKHYFGLRKLQLSPKAATEKLTLLYLFWEPINWADIAECQRHRQEVEAFAQRVAASSIPLRWMSYSQLWQEWTGIPALREHAANLKARYEVRI